MLQGRAPLFAGAMTLAVTVAVAVAGRASGERTGPRRAPAGPAPSPWASAAVDLTGYWVSVVNEDWRWRMVTPPKGDYASVPMTDEARKVADTWDVSKDGQCEAYGAAGADAHADARAHHLGERHTLKIETDAGQQTRRFTFDRTAQATGAALAAGLLEGRVGASRGRWRPRPGRDRAAT